MIRIFIRILAHFLCPNLHQKLTLKFHGDKNKEVLDIIPCMQKLSEISFYHSSKYKEDFNKTKAGVIVIDKSTKTSSNKNYLIVDDPYVGMAKIASIFYPDCEYPNFYFEENELMSSLDNSIKCSRNVCIHKDSRIGKNCEIGSFVKIGPGVSIGDNCLIGDNVSVYYAKISNNVKIYQGVKIGGEGFGFIAKKDFFKKIPQLGRVIIDENVEIGCNSTIDRGSIGDTVIRKKNTMIDNLVHIAHNVKIGENSIIAAMTGISGSTEIGKNAMINRTSRY